MMAGVRDPAVNLPQGVRVPDARSQAAAVVGVSGKLLSDAKAIKRESPEMFARVKAGEMTVTHARRDIQRAAVKDSPPLPDGKFRVIYADPPWKYGDQLTEDYGATKYHYPSMTLANLCLLPIRDMAADNAVLFLWVTSPLLYECAPLISAWGFTYKAMFIWDKVKHNMGHYNSVRHELLLICTRGSCMPDVPTLMDSVVSIERTTHSTKPPQFREMIDKLYPHGARIELFARSEPIAGWMKWGNVAK